MLQARFRHEVFQNVALIKKGLRRGHSLIPSHALTFQNVALIKKGLRHSPPLAWSMSGHFQNVALIKKGLRLRETIDSYGHRKISKRSPD